MDDLFISSLMKLVSSVFTDKITTSVRDNILVVLEDSRFESSKTEIVEYLSSSEIKEEPQYYERGKIEKSDNDDDSLTEE